MQKRWDAFISHASEDKEAIVKDLSNHLTALDLKIWYDKFTLQIGDSLSQKIDEGLKESNFGIVIISKPFLNKKWTDYEYRSLLSKEDNYKKIILPIWHQVTYDDVKSFSLYLADKFALDTSKDNLKNISLKLLQVIRPDIFDNLYRLMLFKKRVKEGELKEVNPKDLTWGDKQRETLPKGYINRIKSYYYSIGQNFNASLKETLNCYLYDHNPDREIQVWEIMNATYNDYIHKHHLTDKEPKKEIATLLFYMSMGKLYEETKLSFEEANELYEIWKSNFHPY